MNTLLDIPHSAFIAESDPIVVLSLWQPWASLMAWNEKEIESRSWPTRYRGWVAIHATKGMPREAVREMLENETIAHLCAQHGHSTAVSLPKGAIVAVGRLDRVEETASPWLIERLTDKEKRLGNYGPRRYAWVFANVRAIEPLPYTGAMGLQPVRDPYWHGAIRAGYNQAA